MPWASSTYRTAPCSRATSSSSASGAIAPLMLKTPLTATIAALEGPASLSAWPSGRGRNWRRSRPSARWPSELGPLLDRVVGVGVHGQDVVPGHQGGDRAQVRQRDGRVDQHRLGPEPSRQPFLGLGVGPDAGKGPRGPVVRPPAPDAPLQSLTNPGVLVEPEEAVRAEVDHPMAVDHQPPFRPDLVHDEIFHVDVGVELGEMIEESDDAAASQRVRESPIGSLMVDRP